MDHFTTDNELITKYVKELKLPTVKDCLDDTIALALASGWDYRWFLATLLPEFETLDFIRSGRNIVMYGNPGTGKTHMAIGLGIKDKVLCSALVDRLCHKAFMVNMTGPSYRVKETQNIFKKL